MDELVSMSDDATTNGNASMNDLRLRDPVLTVDQVASLLQVDIGTVKHEHRMRRLRGHRIGRALRWRKSEVDRFVEALGR